MNDAIDRAAVARAVRRARERAGYTQDQAAEIAGLGVATWRQLEAGEAVRSLTWAKAERALGWEAGTLEAVSLGENRPLPATPSGEKPADRLSPADVADDLETAQRLIARALRHLRGDGTEES